MISFLKGHRSHKAATDWPQFTTGLIENLPSIPEPLYSWAEQPSDFRWLLNGEFPDAKDTDLWIHYLQIQGTLASLRLGISLHATDSFSFLHLSKKTISLKNMLFYIVSLGNTRINVKAALFLLVTQKHGRSSEKLYSCSSFLSEWVCLYISVIYLLM